MAAEEFYEQVVADATAATEKFEETLHNSESVADQAGALGVLVREISGAVSEFGGGMGEYLESQAQSAFGSEAFGSGFFAELTEGFLAVSGELAEMSTEVSALIGGWAGNVAGSVLEAGGRATGHMADAALSLWEGKLDETLDDLIAAVETVGRGSIQVGMDSVSAQVQVIWETIEGFAEIGWELGEGVVETTVGAASDLSELVEGLASWAAESFDQEEAVVDAPLQGSSTETVDVSEGSWVQDITNEVVGGVTAFLELADGIVLSWGEANESASFEPGDAALQVSVPEPIESHDILGSQSPVETPEINHEGDAIGAPHADGVSDGGF